MSQLCRAAACSLIVVGAAASLASANGINPNYRSNLESIQPPVPGLKVVVIRGDDQLELRNETGRTIVVEGYDGEPYLRFRTTGVVEVNSNSPARYLNEDRLARVEVPPNATAEAKPRWEEVRTNGRYDWHDHRIHWMGTGTPPQVKDKAERTKIFDWKVPLTVGSREVEVTGTLMWVPPPSSGMPTAAIVGLVAFCLAALAAAVAVRRRRRTKPPGAKEEAW